MPPAKDTARTARLRENKRRSRERQRQYTADLEQKLRQLQQRGIQATIEVQTAARVVAEENQRLRALLRHVGVNPETIDTWFRGGVASENTEGGGRRQQANSDQVVCNQLLKQSSEQQKSRNSQHQCLRVKGSGYSAAEIATSSPVTGKPVSAFHSDSRLGHREGERETLRYNTEALPGKTKEAEERPRQQFASPCKFASQLTTDSACDASGLLAPSEDEQDPASNQDGVPCSTAYRLLMRHAKGEQEIQALGRVLKEGCSPTPDGGCKVKHGTVARALVDICL